MAINNSQHFFRKLIEDVFPKYTQELRNMIDSPCDLASLNIPNTGIKKCLTKHNKAGDFQGCYVLIEEKNPIYVGISREVFRRLRYHIKGKQDNTATLAYSIACQRFPLDGTRKQKMNNKEFLAHFQKARSRIEKMQFAFVEIKNDFELYVFEAYVALELDTRFNSFRTH
jgi:hypothetical protein